MSRFISHSNVEGCAVRLGEDGDGRNAELAACTDDANRNFTPVRNEDLAKKHEAIVSLLCQRHLNGLG